MNFVIELRRHLYILALFAKNSIISQMEYRVNFITGIFVEAAFLMAKLLYVMVVYKTNVHIDGLTPDTILMFMGTHILLTGIYMGLFYNNFQRLTEYVRNGMLDLMIVKPISLQFLVSVRHIEVGMPIPNIIAGSVMVAIGWSASDIPFTFLNVALFITFMFIATIMTYCIMIIPSLLSFWFLNTSAASEISYSVWDANNMPHLIYNKWIQRIGTFIIPVFIITNFAPLVVLHKLTKIEIVWGILAPIVFFLLIRVLWKRALKVYSSSNL
ncbi:ABC transporter permease [Paenibacillus sp. IHBB 10380]|uniref:ABC transporter permease n=1 Tax=Paenibacillus sp. IHBB 10380 TaxID=1566358 RepID=UPI0005CFBD17|nr:ABC-2 family transporter protein [Paenibacillus sp. IHBB 10380]AJS60885.1 ABC transporter permease [Paenibacillus sp. IHBB 10380]